MRCMSRVCSFRRKGIKWFISRMLLLLPMMYTMFQIYSRYQEYKEMYYVNFSGYKLENSTCTVVWWPKLISFPGAHVNTSQMLIANDCIYVNDYKQKISDMKRNLQQTKLSVLNMAKEFYTMEQHHQLQQKYKFKFVPNFQPIDFTKGYTVSAFHVRDEKNFYVKVMYIFPLDSPSLYCQTSCNQNCISIQGRIERLYFFHEETEKCIWHQYILHCKLPLTCKAKSISLTSHPCIVPTNYLYISNTYTDSRPKAVLGVCLNHMYNLKAPDMRKVVNFFERFLHYGGERVYLYGANGIDSAISNVLQYYEKKGVLKVYDWTVPRDVTSLFYFGQNLQNMDCLYRHRNEVQYLAFLDLDEVILPIAYTNYTALLRNAFWKIDAGVLISRLRMKTSMQKTKQRKMNSLCFLSVGKPLVRPKLVSTVGIHYIVSPVSYFTFFFHFLDPKMAVIIHFRDEQTCDTNTILEKDYLMNIEREVFKTNFQVVNKSEKISSMMNIK